VIRWFIRRLLWRRLVGRRRQGAGPDPRLLDIARGLALGALVGAAIAGSGILRRRRRS
jgi:hypothetical protein